MVATNHYKKAVFLLSAPAIENLPPDKGREVAFIGCSNVGKSSTLNALTENTKLARTSKTPGRTQSINLFRIEGEKRLVDLPGYGYAEVPEAVKVKWQRMIDQYLRGRKCLVGLVLLMDIRTPLKLFEKQMLAWATSSDVAIHVILNKVDKLSKMAVKSTVVRVEKALEMYEDKISMQLFSAKEGIGLEELRSTLDHWYGF